MNQPPSGFLLINKPAGMTSHDVIDRLRRITGIRTIGHAGTLDPFATGLLIVGVGREATKHLNTFLRQDKKYQAEIFLGATSDTDDVEGKIISQENIKVPSEEEVQECLKKFLGKQTQTVPAYSAKKLKGKKLYELAREGKEFKQPAHEVEIFDLNMTNYEFPKLVISVHCASGTYIRALGRDIGEKLKTGGYLTSLTRTAIGAYELSQAHDLSYFTAENWQEMLFQI